MLVDDNKSQLCGFHVLLVLDGLLYRVSVSSIIVILFLLNSHKFDSILKTTKEQHIA